MRFGLIAFFVFAVNTLYGQQRLTVDYIMQDPKWMGTQPSEPQWSADGRRLYFLWNPTRQIADSLYVIDPQKPVPVRLSAQEESLLPQGAIIYNQDVSRKDFAFTAQGDLFYNDGKGNLRRLTQTEETELVRQLMEGQLVFTRGGQYFALEPGTGLTSQWIQLQKGQAPKTGAQSTTQQWLQREALGYSDVLSERKRNRDSGVSYRKRLMPKPLRTLYTGEKTAFNGQFSSNGRFFAAILRQSINEDKNTNVPTYVTENGYTQTLNSRPKVGFASSESELLLYDRVKDTILTVNFSNLPGRKTLPLYLSEYPYPDSVKKQYNRQLNVRDIGWNPSGTALAIEVTGTDNKDRWIVLWLPDSANLKIVSHQHDEAWIGGPGISGAGDWLNNDELLFQNEATGFSHLYRANVRTGLTTQLTDGKWEVSNARLSRDRRVIYYHANKTNPGDYQYYQLDLATGKTAQLTQQPGLNRVWLSPDEKWLALLHSEPNIPWELSVRPNRSGASWTAVTTLARSDSFRAYQWRIPEQITFTARDGATVYGRLYKPANPHPAKPAVLFVHGAGYLQNVHLGWSRYFREYMFHNLLADEGYTVLDIDYRGSEGYGRDWRTGIYRHMGGKDLTDNLDGIDYLAKNHGVNPQRVGIYGGSYGGFITLMALFTQPGRFAAGAALRPVTDWAHYNHGYTSNILNIPVWDSVAYARSSPIQFAEGLQDPLLICHGLVDVNVHVQDVMRLSQRLIELRKDNWEVALYPLEDHGFVESSSWADEYKRILKLFERELKR